MVSQPADNDPPLMLYVPLAAGLLPRVRLPLLLLVPPDWVNVPVPETPMYSFAANNCPLPLRLYVPPRTELVPRLTE